jgi:hypothetical protein
MNSNRRPRFGGEGKALPVASLPLFAWAEARAVSANSPETFAERALMKRLHMPLHMIRVYAENAGLGGHR